MHQLLILEDEELLRASVRKGLSTLPSLEIVDVGTFAAALAAIDEVPPDLVLSDLNLPDRSGIELLAELQDRNLAVPVVFMSAYLESFRGELSQHPYVDVLEKPVSMESLRELVGRRLEMLDRSAAALPFGVPDYLQLAGMGRHSVVIEALDQGHALGQIIVYRGDLWSATDRRGRGQDAFARLATAEDVRVVCRTLRGQPKEGRMFERSWESMLLDAVRLKDEAERGGGAFGTMTDLSAAADAAVSNEDDWAALDDGWIDADPDPASAPAAPPAEQPDEPTPRVGGETFESLLEEGLDALLERDHASAAQAFLAARELRPDDGRVTANIERLRALGHIPAGDEETRS
jgi:CheY-like chemotaxis protein